MCAWTNLSKEKGRSEVASVNRKYRYGDENYDSPICPVCGEECETLYLQDGNVIGCDSCVSEKNAWEWWDEYQDQFSHTGF